VRERVGHQQIAEFVVNSGNGDGEKGKRQEPNGDDGEEQDEDGEHSAFGEMREGLLDAAEEVIGGVWEEQRN